MFNYQKEVAMCFGAMRVAATLSAVLLASGTAALAQHEHKAAGMTDEQIIASAMKAAPEAVAKDAAVIDVGADGKVRVVREGSNGFTCVADSPSTPGPDPMCGDANAMEWVKAWIGRATPPAGKVGFMFMLEGGTDASNTDPYAGKPTADNNWVTTGPHVMVVGAVGLMAGYPRSVDPDTSKPYVMWPDTPYEHLMIPVQ